MRSTTLALLVALAASTATSLALADVTPPDVDACRTTDAGGACTLNGVAGACRQGTCTRVDYMNWNRDASSTPPTVSYDCVRCVTGTATDASAAPPAPTSASGGCSVGDLGRAVGPWALAAIPLALVLLGRRRRAR